jgi:mono/diheme cytochrome c family protein
MHERVDRYILGVSFLILATSALSACTDKGAALFETEVCIQCHSFKGVGGNMAPDLTAVTNRRSDGWISQQIKNPKKNNPDSRMPDYKHLSEMEIKALISFMKN